MPSVKKGNCVEEAWSVSTAPVAQIKRLIQSGTLPSAINGPTTR